MITIKDLARELNLHHTTVSKALGNHPDISQKTRERVQALAKKLDYHPNTIAQSFKRRQSFTLGVIVPQLQVDFFAKLISGVEEIAYKNGYTIMIFQSGDDSEREAMQVRTMVSHQIAGVIVALAETTQTLDAFQPLIRKETPVAYVDRVLDDPGFFHITSDDFNGAYHAVNYLIEQGCRRIAHLAAQTNISVSRERMRGYKQALIDHDLPVDDELIIFGRFQESSGKAGCKQLLDLAEPPDAIFAVNDFVALGTYNQIKERGLKIPNDISVIGFGDLQISKYLDPPLTTVKQCPVDMGRFAAKSILEQIRDKVEMESKVLKTELVIRESTR